MRKGRKNLARVPTVGHGISVMGRFGAVILPEGLAWFKEIK